MSHHEEETFQEEKAKEESKATEESETKELSEEDLENLNGGSNSLPGVLGVFGHMGDGN